MELSNRLEAVVGMVPPCKTVCDVGCDHGYVAIELINRKKCEYVIAADVNKGPLNAARENVLTFGLQEYIETRISDGLSSIHMQDKADCVVIAGMGARLMQKIMTKGQGHVSSHCRYVLQPQSEWHLMRKFLRDNHYQIVKENMVLDAGKYYVIMDVTHRDSLSEEMVQSNVDKEAKDAKGEISSERRRKIYDYYSEYLIHMKHPVLLDYLQKGYAANQSILEGISPDKRESLLEKNRLIEDAIELMQ